MPNSEISYPEKQSNLEQEQLEKDLVLFAMSCAVFNEIPVGEISRSRVQRNTLGQCIINSARTINALYHGFSEYFLEYFLVIENILKNKVRLLFKSCSFCC